MLGPLYLERGSAREGKTCPACRRPLQEKSISYRKLKRVKACLYDIARHQAGTMTPPKRVFERVCESAKHMTVNGKLIWPRYSDPTPDPFTGEVLYEPKHTNDLTDREEQGIYNWLNDYMVANDIPSHAPADTWQIPDPISGQA